MKKEYDYEIDLYIEKNFTSNPILSGDMDLVNVKEVYKGKDHFIHFELKKRAEFMCPFNKVKFYPFGDEECYFAFTIAGSIFEKFCRK